MLIECAPVSKDPKPGTLLRRDRGRIPQSRAKRQRERARAAGQAGALTPAAPAQVAGPTHAPATGQNRPAMPAHLQGLPGFRMAPVTDTGSSSVASGSSTGRHSHTSGSSVRSNGHHDTSLQDTASSAHRPPVRSEAGPTLSRLSSLPRGASSNAWEAGPSHGRPSGSSHQLHNTVSESGMSSGSLSHGSSGTSARLGHSPSPTQHEYWSESESGHSNAPARGPTRSGCSRDSSQDNSKRPRRGG